jgi:glycosyltransferase involved in cell wall biosynthesis
MERSSARAPRVLLVHQGAEMYGSDRVFAQVAAVADALGEAHVVLDAEGPLAIGLRDRGIEVEILPLGVLRRDGLTPKGIVRTLLHLMRASGRLREIVERRGMDVVYSSTIGVLAGALAARATKRPHVWHIHEILTEPEWLARRLAIFVARGSNEVICVSEATSANLRTQSGDPGMRSTVINNGIPPTVVDEAARLAVVSELGIGRDDFVVAMVGRISPWKGQDVLIAAVAALPQEVRRRTRVLLVGDVFRGYEATKTSLEQQADSLGLVATVSFLGYRADAVTIMASSDVVVVPSLRPESFGLVALEAMGAGRPVVASRLGGMAELVVDDATGYLVPPGDAAALADRLEALARDSNLRTRLGIAGRRRAEGMFSEAEFEHSVRRVLVDALHMEESAEE